MSELNASLYHLQNTQSISFKFFSESLEEIERQINSTGGLNFFTEQMDFIVLMCDQFQKLTKLRSKSELIDDLLSQYFPELCKLGEDSNILVAPEPASNETVEPVDKEIENEITFVCDICDEKVPILNGDFNYSTQLHLSSSVHQEVVSVYCEIEKFNAITSSTADSSLNSTFVTPQNGPPEVDSVLKTVPSGSKSAPQSVCSNSKTTQPRKQLPVPRPITVAEESFQRFNWIWSQRQNEYLLWYHSYYYCCLCDAYLTSQHNFDAHVRSFMHKSQIRQELNNVATRRVGSDWMENVAYNYNQSSINQVATPTRNTYRNAMKNETWNVSPDFSVIRNGKQYCTLCNAMLPGKAQQDSHFNGSLHKKRLKMVAKKPASKS